jgi:hypothetical protein
MALTIFTDHVSFLPTGRALARGDQRASGQVAGRQRVLMQFDIETMLPVMCDC